MHGATGVSKSLSPRQRCHRLPQALLLAATLASGTLAAIFGFFYLFLYWPYRDLFNDEGRYFDQQGLVVYHEQASLLMIPALAFLVLALLFAVVLWVRRAGAGSGNSGAS